MAIGIHCVRSVLVTRVEMRLMGPKRVLQTLDEKQLAQSLPYPYSGELCNIGYACTILANYAIRFFQTSSSSSSSVLSEKKSTRHKHTQTGITALSFFPTWPRMSTSGSLTHFVLLICFFNFFFKLLKRVLVLHVSRKSRTWHGMQGCAVGNRTATCGGVVLSLAPPSRHLD